MMQDVLRKAGKLEVLNRLSVTNPKTIFIKYGSTDLLKNNSSLSPSKR